MGEAARDGRLSPSALVVGVILDGGTRAYPVDDLSEPINDEVGEEPIVLFPTDGGASVYAATLDGERLQFRRSGDEFIDVDTGSVWTSAGIAISGTHRGARLAPIPSRTTFWFAFVGAFPDVDVPTG